ncbi:DUF4395 domain-containing protein [Nocardia huaxiensis]|uniref:DUF4395 domain-containing protein n=1 Tax=Nocardia huaxiensis TaxID=2755382 RepID=A0A7D6ZBK7_9NOCA|nr:DUF4395 domain-containing protein [Nocardia huaxiensis]QLY31608.1 DUF4395 domain-containing protein [Nocardia huaxiensis]UFS95161.1 DUF4395 domain-containing protein [Nocardia huaxiensis]
MSNPNTPGSTQNSTAPTGQVDVRGPRFAAWITTAALALVLIIATFSVPAATVLLALQAAVFALGAAYGPRRSPYGRLYATYVAPKIGPAPAVEPVAPLRFAQLVGLVFAVIGVLGYAAGNSVIGAIFTGFALFAAFLNAAFGICLGCKIYPLVSRFRTAPTNPHPTA